MRLFIAVDVPKADARDIKTCAAAFSNCEHLRVAAEKQMHLTLCFLGERSESQLPDILSVMEQASRGVDPFQIRYRGISAFPHIHRPRVVIVPVTEGVEHLQGLEYFLHKRLKASGSHKRYVPHITLGRVRRPHARLTGLLQDQAWRHNPEGTFKVERLTLYQSVLHPSGAQYTICSQRALGK